VFVKVGGFPARIDHLSQTADRPTDLCYRLMHSCSDCNLTALDQPVPRSTTSAVKMTESSLP